MKEMVVVSTRLEPQYAEAFQKVANSRGITISALLREFAMKADSFYEFVERERLRQKGETIQLNGNLAEWVINNAPPGVSAEMLNFLSEVLKHAASIKKAKEEK